MEEVGIGGICNLGGNWSDVAVGGGGSLLLRWDR